jgi:hypothetical protein
MLSEAELSLAKAQRVETSLPWRGGCGNRDPSTQIFFASEEESSLRRTTEAAGGIQNEAGIGYPDPDPGLVPTKNFDPA